MNLQLIMRFVAVAVAAAAAAPAPTGLLCDYKRSASALGIRAEPRLSWIVPPCAHLSDHMQSHYQLVFTADGGAIIWDSGKVASNNSIAVEYAGFQLQPGVRFSWTVKTWTQDSSGGQCESAISAPTTFVTSLFTGWESKARFIALSAAPTFAYFRKVIKIGAVQSARAFIAAPLETPLLANYKLFIDGQLVDVGPGRGEAPVWGGDGTFRSLPYASLDVTSSFASNSTSPHTLAIEAMNSKGASVMMQLMLTTADNVTMTYVTDSTWSGFNGDVHRNPGPPKHGHSAGTGYIEYIDARHEPVGWKHSSFMPAASWGAVTAAAPTASQLKELHAKMEPPLQVYPIPVKSIRPVPAPPTPPTSPVACGVVGEDKVLLLGCPDGKAISGVAFAAWGTPGGTCPHNLTHSPKCDDAGKVKPIVEKACVGKVGCSIKADRGALEDPCYGVVKTLAIELHCPPAPPAPPPPPSSAFVADFGREFQGGLRLSVPDGTSGTNVHISCGESLKGDTVGSTWGWEFDWTLRDGQQVLEQHKYMECRFVSLTFSGPAPAGFALSAWKVHYPWFEDDSAFVSSNATLNAVWHLARYTVNAASLTTYSDSNTRERRPYEADGVIAASARLLVQRDVLWARHSHAWVIQYPTWPVEWKQLTPFLGWQDYQWTGQPDLALAFMSQMRDRSMIGYLENSTGLLRTDKMGRHIVDWMPDGRETDETVARHEFTASNHMSVTNAFCMRGLEMLSEMAAAGGRQANATQFSRAASMLRANMTAKMWNGTAFCDGVCSEVGGHSLLMSNLFSLAFGIVPQKNVDSAWGTVAQWGLEQIGDYGAFWYQAALAGSYYAPHYDTPDTDDGTAILTALTKCDRYSWCSGLRDDNLTMTRESWHDGTYSHEWGASPIVGVAWGVMGVHQTAPGWASFTVKPKLGGLSHANAVVPTIRGYINVSAKPSALEVRVPCNSVATLCLPRTAHDTAPRKTRLLLDGVEIPSATHGGHLCGVHGVGCGAGGAPRRLSAPL